MRLIRLRVEGFESAAEPVEVNYENKNMLAFVGENGAGKSMLSIWAPVFALYGKTRSRTVGESISTSCGSASVELDFSMNGNTYRITRKVPRTGRQEAVLYVLDENTDTWTPLTEKEVRSTNAAIIEIIGMDYDGARTTFLAEQGQYGLFCEGTPSERRRMLNDVLSLGGYEELKDAADRKHAELLTAVSAAEASAGEVATMRAAIVTGNPLFSHLSDEDILEEIDLLREKEAEVARIEAESSRASADLERELADAQRARSEWQSSMRERLTVLRSSLNSINLDFFENRLGSEGYYDTALQRIARAREARPQMQQFFDDRSARIEKGRSLIAEDTASLNLIAEEGGRLNARIVELEATLAEVEEQRAHLSRSEHRGAECMTCTQPLTPQLVEMVKEGIDRKERQAKEGLQQARERIEQCRKAHRDTSAALAAKQQLMATYESEINQARSDLSVMDQVIEGAAQIESERAAEAASYEQAREQHARLMSEIAAVEGASVPVEMVERISRAQEALSGAVSQTPEVDTSHRDRLAALERETAVREAGRAQEVALDERAQQIDKELIDLRLDVEHHSTLRKAFGPTGIPAMILAGALSELENDANEYLEKISRGALRLNFETQRTTQKGKVNEEITVTITAPDGTRDYASFSGGQKFRIDLAIRIAMRKVAARRAGTSAVETLFIDEGFGALDEAGKMSTITALSELSQEMAVVAVSHIDSVKESFPDLIEVRLEAGTTAIREIRTAGI